MAQPIYDPSEQIRRTGQEVASNIGSSIDSIAEGRLNRARQAEAKLQEVSALKNELGKIGSEYLKEEIDEVSKSMRASIYKKAKKSGNYSVDLAAIGDYRDKLTELRNLADNTRALDETYGELESFITKNKGYFLDEAGFRNDFLRRFTNVESLKVNPTELQADVFNSAVKHLNYEKMITEEMEFGQRPVRIELANGQTTIVNAPEYLSWNGKEFVLKEEGRSILKAAIQRKQEELQIPEGALTQDDIDDIVNNVAQSSTASYTFEAGDPLFERKQELEMKTKELGVEAAELTVKEKAKDLKDIKGEANITAYFEQMARDALSNDDGSGKTQAASKALEALISSEYSDASFNYDEYGTINTVTIDDITYNPRTPEDFEGLISKIAAKATKSTSKWASENITGNYFNKYYSEKEGDSGDNSVTSGEDSDPLKLDL